jgi:cobalt-zinc-cadmium efflux system outer membrane protein
MLISIARRGGVCFCLLALGAPAFGQATLTLPEALTRTVARNPELQVLGYQREALAGELTQAGLAPNPELNVALQDGLGTDIYSGFDSAETTVTLGWLLERGVRERRIDSARAGLELGDADAEIARLDAAAETARRFIMCLAYQARMSWAADAVRLAEETVAAVGERVAASRTPAAELARAEAALARAELIAEDYEHEFLSASHRLSAQWGETTPDFATVAGNLMNLPSLEPFAALAARANQNPDLARYVSHQRLRTAELALAQAQARPAWQLSAGLRRYEASDDVALVGGITIPLTVRNRNEGRIAAARANLARIDAERTAAEVRIETALFVLHQEFNHYLHTARRLQADIVPRLEQALIDTRRAYELGRYSYLDWRAVQSELLEAHEALLEASIDAHGIAIEIERLTGVTMVPTVTAQ